MKWETEIMSPDSSYVSNSSWLFEEKTNWTSAENKAFENALAVFDKDTPDRWLKVAEMVPGKSIGDVIRQYKELEDDVSSIEAGIFPIFGHGNGNETSGFTLEWGSNQEFDGFKEYSHGVIGKKSCSIRSSDQERKKGVPWTEEEHKLFLKGLKKYGKGDWRNISRNYVITRTPTQVASHAQKYYARQLSGGKDKRRASIHDITTVSLNDSQTCSPDNKNTPSPERLTTVFSQHMSNSILNSNTVNETPFQWNQVNNGTLMNFNTGGHGNNVSLYDVNKGLNMPKSAMFDSYFGCQNMMFQMQSTHQYHHA